LVTRGCRPPGRAGSGDACCPPCEAMRGGCLTQVPRSAEGVRAKSGIGSKRASGRCGHGRQALPECTTCGTPFATAKAGKRPAAASLAGAERSGKQAHV